MIVNKINALISIIINYYNNNIQNTQFYLDNYCILYLWKTRYTYNLYTKCSYIITYTAYVKFYSVFFRGHIVCIFFRVNIGLRRFLSRHDFELVSQRKHHVTFVLTIEIANVLFSAATSKFSELIKFFSNRKYNK